MHHSAEAVACLSEVMRKVYAMHANDKSWLFSTTDGRRYGKGGWRKFALRRVPKWVRAAEKISCDLSSAASEEEFYRRFCVEVILAAMNRAEK